MGDSTPIRTAMSEAYLGDSKNFHAMFAEPQTLDLRIQSILSGFAQHTDAATADDLAMAANLRAIAKRLAATDQTARIALIDKLKTFYTESERIVPAASMGVLSTYTGTAGGTQAATYFNGQITRHSEFGWSLSLNAEFPVAIAAGVVRYSISADSSESPLFFEFCQALETLGPPKANVSGVGSYSFPPEPFHPVTSSLIILPTSASLFISANRAPTQKHVIGNNCDLSCTLHYNFTP